MNARIIGINLARAVPPDEFIPLAYADIAFDDIGLTLAGVMLARSKERLVTLPPKTCLSARPRDQSANWSFGAPIERAATEAVSKAFFALGGVVPEYEPKGKKAKPAPEPDGDDAGLKRVLRADVAECMEAAGL